MSDDKEYLKTNNPSEETDEKENKDQYEKICFMCRRPESMLLSLSILSRLPDFCG